MKKLFTLLFISLSAIQFSQAQLSAFMAFSSFDQPEGTPYLETYLKVLGGSSKLVALPSGKLQSKIEVKWIFKSGDKIVHFEKYNLLSPEVSPYDSLIPDFINQQRINLPNGIYNVELTLKDFNFPEKELNVSKEIKINFNKEKVMISDIELLESFSQTTTPNIYSKNGYDLIPYADNYYATQLDKIRFYAEIYNTQITNNDPFIVRYYVSNSNNDKIIEDLLIMKKQNAQKVNVVLAEFPIENLPSGNYDINIEVINKENKLLAFTHTFFQRSNSVRKPIADRNLDELDITNTFVSNITNPDTLVYLIDVLYPISSQGEYQIAENQMALRDMKSMQKYIYYFWSKRNPADPQRSWEEYMLEVYKVNNSYGALNKYGYETDRGRVYLQYGPPSSTTEIHDDPESYPYEIWHYYKLENQTNRKFVFYCPELVTRNYKILHSDAKGEIDNPKWELDLHSRGQQYGPDIDRENSMDIYGSQTKDNFKNPR
jgi:GWxTD domain-containing protein